MAKKIYVGDEGTAAQKIVSDIVPKSWTVQTTGTKYKANDGTILSATSYDIGDSKYAYYACDGNENTYWLSDENTTLKSLTLEFPKAIIATKMKVKIKSSNMESFNIQGIGSDGVGVELYSSKPSDVLTEITLNNTKAYKTYKLNVKPNGYVLEAYVYEWQISEYIIPAQPSVAREVKKIYMGINGIARKIKKAYIGINGIAKQFYSSIEPQTITSFSTPSFTSSTHTDEFGSTWSVSPSSAYKAWDQDDSTYYTGSASSTTRLTLTLPDGYYLTPKKFHYTCRYCSWDLYGVTADGTEYSITSGGNGGTSTVDSYTEIKSTNQREYVKFYLDISSYNSSTAPQMKEAYFYSSTLRIG